MAYLGQIPAPTERMDYYPPNYPVDKYGYGVHEGEYSTEPPGNLYDPNREQNCATYCAWLAAKKAGSLTMDYMERPPGCTCPDEVDAKKQGFPVTKPGTEYTTELPMTPQQIEAAVKREQSAPAGGGLALAAIAALLLLG